MLLMLFGGFWSYRNVTGKKGQQMQNTHPPKSSSAKGSKLFGLSEV
jgi:hypothetical protein